jgi:hypothetical protein
MVAFSQIMAEHSALSAAERLNFYFNLILSSINLYLIDEVLHTISPSSETFMFWWADISP